ncbi:MAG: metallophosphoesterase family protein [Verrucomicrobia bacterium]|nr:metallophosphoesterase family protein [Verrucomicrobiota bacterium]
MNTRLFLSLSFIWILFVPVSFAAEPVKFDPPALYLTWQREPSTTMTVHWHSDWTDGFRDPALQYREAKSRKWNLAVGAWHPMPFTNRIVHTVELTGLKPSTEYRFRLGKLMARGALGFRFEPDSPTNKFRTMPATGDQPVRFAVGGDVYGDRERYEVMCRQVAELDPHFAIVGGDIAYENGNPANARRWFDFLEVWMTEMVAPDGRLIPILPAIGNHETHGNVYTRGGGGVGSGISPNRSPYYFSLFSMPGKPGYNVLDFGNYLSVFLLDSFHANRVAGPQAEWLEQALNRRRHVKHIVAAYHVPAYPSYRPYRGQVSEMIRENWVPLFEKGGLRLVFEHHDHTYKRTHPLRAGKIDPKGIVYVGDGCWGVLPRKTHPVDKTWYLARAESINHVNFVTFQGDRRHVKSVDIDGRAIDEFRLDGNGPVVNVSRN